MEEHRLHVAFWNGKNHTTFYAQPEHNRIAVKVLASDDLAAFKQRVREKREEKNFHATADEYSKTLSQDHYSTWHINGHKITLQILLNENHELYHTHEQKLQKAKRVFNTIKFNPKLEYYQATKPVGIFSSLYLELPQRIPKAILRFLIRVSIEIPTLNQRYIGSDCFHFRESSKPKADKHNVSPPLYSPNNPTVNPNNSTSSSNSSAPNPNNTFMPMYQIEFDQFPFSSSFNLNELNQMHGANSTLSNSSSDNDNGTLSKSLSIDSNDPTLQDIIGSYINHQDTYPQSFDSQQSAYYFSLMKEKQLSLSSEINNITRVNSFGNNNNNSINNSINNNNNNINNNDTAKSPLCVSVTIKTREGIKIWVKREDKYELVNGVAQIKRINPNYIYFGRYGVLGADQTIPFAPHLSDVLFTADEENKLEFVSREHFILSESWDQNANENPLDDNSSNLSIKLLGRNKIKVNERFISQFECVTLISENLNLSQIHLGSNIKVKFSLDTPGKGGIVLMIKHRTF